MDAKTGLLRKVNDIHRDRLFAKMQAQAQGHPITEAMRAAAEKTHLEQNQSNRR